MESGCAWDTIARVSTNESANRDSFVILPHPMATNLSLLSSLQEKRREHALKLSYVHRFGTTRDPHPDAPLDRNRCNTSVPFKYAPTSALKSTIDGVFRHKASRAQLNTSSIVSETIKITANGCVKKEVEYSESTLGRSGHYLSSRRASKTSYRRSGRRAEGGVFWICP